MQISPPLNIKAHNSNQRNCTKYFVFDIVTWHIFYLYELFLKTIMKIWKKKNSFIYRLYQITDFYAKSEKQKFSNAGLILERDGTFIWLLGDAVDTVAE